MKKLLALILSVVLVCTFSISAFAATHTHSFSASTYDSDSSDTMLCSSCGASYFTNGGMVDSGKHLDYDATTTYSDLVDDCVAIWNGYKSGIIRKDTYRIRSC